MRSPEPRPVLDHLDHWTRPEKADAAEAVKGLLESPGWEAIQRSIEDRLRFEQRMTMTAPPSGDDSAARAKYERMIGQWAGLRQASAIAEGIVAAGEAAAKEMAA